MTNVRDDLREFLRTRRGRIDPASVGLPLGDSPRRVPGLRREELARLAGVSVDYYVRLEQGRATGVSEDVLSAVARVLRLDDHERTYLFDLAQPSTNRRRTVRARAQRVRPGVLLLLDTIESPAFVVGRRLDILASNRMARALLGDLEDPAPAERNYARWVFRDPAARDLHVDWEAVARDNVASLRMEAGRHPDDQVLCSLIGELTVHSTEFATWWAEHEVLRLTHGSKRYRHPVVGELTVSFEALPIPDDPEQTLYVYSAEPGSASAHALQLLASWTMAGAAPSPSA